MVEFYGAEFRARLRAGEGAEDLRSVLGPEDFSDEDDLGDDEAEVVESGMDEPAAYGRMAAGAPQGNGGPRPQRARPLPSSAPGLQAARLDDGASTASGHSWAALGEPELLRRLQSFSTP